MSEPNDERHMDRLPNSDDDLRFRAAVVAGKTTMLAGLIPFGVLFSLATGTGMLISVGVTLLLQFMVAFPMGDYCGQVGWWLTRNSTIDSRIMAIALAAILELTLLGWLIVIWNQLLPI